MWLLQVYWLHWVACCCYDASLLTGCLIDVKLMNCLLWCRLVGSMELEARTIVHWINDWWWMMMQGVLMGCLWMFCRWFVWWMQGWCYAFCRHIMVSMMMDARLLWLMWLEGASHCCADLFNDGWKDDVECCMLLMMLWYYALLWICCQMETWC